MMYLILLFNFLSFIFANTITITWSTPENLNGPLTQRQSLKAIETHLQALHLAQTLPSLLGTQNSLQIKLCPPQPYDPIVKEITVPRFAGYSAIYDHECINSDKTVEIKWGWKPNKPETPKPPTDRFKGLKGLSVPAFLLELIKSKSKTDENVDLKQVWMIDSDSLKSWLTAPILAQLKNPKKISSPASQLMSQINTMYGLLGEKDLKNMPQAIQGALVLVLPDYSAWKDVEFKSFFNPTWWTTRFIPKTKDSIIEILKQSIDKQRINNQLIIIQHNPTTFNLEIVKSLSFHYGQTNLISSTNVLPKNASTLQLLQFIQKAAGIIVDSRDQLGQLVLFSTDNANLIQNNMPYTTYEMVLMTSLVIWFISVLSMRIYYTQKYYDVSLHEHAKRFALFAILALAPIYATCPSWWPSFSSTAILTVFEAGYEMVLYAIASFYSIALFLTAIVILSKKYKKNLNLSSQEFDEESVESSSEEINLIQK